MFPGMIFSSAQTKQQAASSLECPLPVAECRARKACLEPDSSRAGEVGRMGPGVVVAEEPRLLHDQRADRTLLLCPG